jgi:hypothetical protein
MRAGLRYGPEAMAALLARTPANGLKNLIASRKAAEDSRTPGRYRAALDQIASARSWSAAVLCRFVLATSHGFPSPVPLGSAGLVLLISSPAIGRPGLRVPAEPPPSFTSEMLPASAFGSQPFLDALPGILQHPCK